MSKINKKEDRTGFFNRQMKCFYESFDNKVRIKLLIQDDCSEI